jgi:DNA-directed RNA polymerase specialized sigma24 family protein
VEPIDAQRLSQISTAWTLLARARGRSDDPEARAWAALIERYHEAAYRYLAAIVRDPDVAAELFQEFAVKFLRGDFGRADRARGRFRDYFKTSLRHLVSAHHRGRATRPGPALEHPSAIADPREDDTDGSDEEFLTAWRKALLDRAWRALEVGQHDGGAPYFVALRAHTDRPDLTSAQLAEHLTATLGPAEAFTDAGVRKLLQRAREAFTDLLVEEVAGSVPTRDRDRLEQELIDLGFHGYCRRALERWTP